MRLQEAGVFDHLPLTKEKLASDHVRFGSFCAFQPDVGHRELILLLKRKIDQGPVSLVIYAYVGLHLRFQIAFVGIQSEDREAGILNLGWLERVAGFQFDFTQQQAVAKHSVAEDAHSLYGCQLPLGYSNPNVDLSLGRINRHLGIGYLGLQVSVLLVEKQQTFQIVFEDMRMIV